MGHDTMVFLILFIIHSSYLVTGLAVQYQTMIQQVRTHNSTVEHREHAWQKTSCFYSHMEAEALIYHGKSYHLEAIIFVFLTFS